MTLPTVQADDVLIFAVDDERENVDLARRALGSKYDVETFTDPRAALLAARDRKPAAVLVDYRMPEMNGLEFVRELRRLGLAPAVIVTTAFPEIDELLYAEQLRLLFRIVPKPWEPADLRRLVEDAIAEMLYKRALTSIRR